MQKILYILLAACVFLMNTQHGIRIPVGKHGINIGAVDILIWAVFGLWLLNAILKKSIFKIKLPPVVFFAMPVLAVLSLLRIDDLSISAAGKEIFQVVEYFLVAVVLFENFGDSQKKLRGLVSVFLLAASAVVVWGLADYMAAGNAFEAGGAYANINSLGAWFAVALPFVLAIALFDDLKFSQRLILVATVVAGAVITLSGAALAAMLGACLLVLALRSPKLLPVGLAAIALGVLVLPGVLRPNHTDILRNSVAVYLDNNYLLDPAALAERAQKLYDEGPTRYQDVRRVLLLADDADGLTPEGEKLLQTVEHKLKGQQPPVTVVPYNRPVVAIRYKRWQAALKAVLYDPWGFGVGKFQKTVGQFYGSTLPFAYDTDEPEAFNLGIDEPDTFNRFLVTTVELGIPGLLALVWLYLWALSRSIGLFAVAKTGFERGTAAGALAMLAFFPVLSAYSDIFVRGIAVPFIFIICCVFILAKLRRDTT